MDEPRFDVDDVFDEDYLWFYEPMLAERTPADVERIWRALELAPGLELLDAPCGHGRIANALAERGCRVTGLDRSELFLDRARADARERGVEVEYVSGDLRELPWDGRFDRVLNWFTSFGYFDDDANRRVLESACRALKPGGLFAVDVHNLFAFAGRMLPWTVFERDGDLLLDAQEFDVVTGRVETERIAVRGGQSRSMHVSVRFFTFTELRDWLLAAGFGEVVGYDWDTGCDPLTAQSRRMVTVARR